MLVCSRCGEQLPNGTAVCTRCGAPVPGANQRPQGQGQPRPMQRRPQSASSAQGSGQARPQNTRPQGQGRPAPQGQARPQGAQAPRPQGTQGTQGQGRPAPQGQGRPAPGRPQGAQAPRPQGVQGRPAPQGQGRSHQQVQEPQGDLYDEPYDQGDGQFDQGFGTGADEDLSFGAPQIETKGKGKKGKQPKQPKAGKAAKAAKQPKEKKQKAPKAPKEKKPMYSYDANGNLEPLSVKTWVILMIGLMIPIYNIVMIVRAFTKSEKTPEVVHNWVKAQLIMAVVMCALAFVTTFVISFLALSAGLMY